MEWLKRSPAQSPGIATTDRIWYAICYSPDANKVLLFGGSNGGSISYQDTWLWDDLTWALLTPAAKPSVRDSMPLAYDAARQVFVLFGGYNSATGTPNQETWTFDMGTLNWTQQFPTNKPSARGGHGLAFSAAGGHVVLFGGAALGAGGSAELQDTWTWDGTDWTLESPAHVPPARANFMGMCSAGNDVLLFGGSRQNLGSPLTLGDTWIWDGTDWIVQAPVSSPPAMAIPPLGTSTLAGYEAFLFGGMVQFTSFPITYNSDTWGWDGSDWILLAPANTPTGNRGWTMQLAANPLTAPPDDHDGVVLYNGLLSSVEPPGSNMFETWTFAPIPVDTPMITIHHTFGLGN